MRQKKMHFFQIDSCPVNDNDPLFDDDEQGQQATLQSPHSLSSWVLRFSLLLMSLRWNLTCLYFFLSHITQVCGMTNKNERFHQWRRRRIVVTFLLTTYCSLDQSKMTYQMIGSLYLQEKSYEESFFVGFFLFNPSRTVTVVVIWLTDYVSKPTANMRIKRERERKKEE